MDSEGQDGCREKDGDKEEEEEEEFKAVLDLLEEWGGGRSRLVWFREMARLTGIDRGLLRNILNHLKKDGEVTEIRGQNKRIFFALTKHYRQCLQAEPGIGGKGGIAGDGGGRTGVPGRAQKSAERTRKRIERQQRRREARLFSRAKHRRKTVP